jgi:hypothetical protein
VVLKEEEEVEIARDKRLPSSTNLATKRTFLTKMASLLTLIPTPLNLELPQTLMIIPPRKKIRRERL